jgi:hypothetical protein
MHAMTTAQLSNHSGAEKSKHRAFGHILVIPLVAVAVLAAEAAWVAGAARCTDSSFYSLERGSCPGTSARRVDGDSNVGLLT